MMRPVPIPPQGPGGGFVCDMKCPSGWQKDENAFITAILCEALFPYRAVPPVSRAVARALGFIETCESRQIPGTFGFWPEGCAPNWLVRPLPADVDDTALCLSVLRLYGRAAPLSRAGRSALSDAQRLFTYESDRPWVEPGVFETWLDPKSLKNPVDLVVNANSLVLLKNICQFGPQEAAIRRMLARGLAWAGESKARAKLLMPWYPEPIEFLFALERAARMGVAELEVLIGKMHRLGWVRAELASEAVTPICGSDDGRFRWFCEGVSQLRRASCFEGEASMAI